MNEATIHLHVEPLEEVTLPHHPSELKEGTLRAILREAAIDVDHFVNA